MTVKQWKVWLTAGAVASVIGVIGLQQVPEEVKEPKVKTFAEKTVKEKQAQIRTEMAIAKVGDEIPHLRTKSSFTQKVASNKYRKVISTKPEFYEDDNGEYQPIDLTVKEVDALAKANPLRKFDKYVDAGNYRATWKDDKPHDYTFYAGEASIGFEFLTKPDNIDIETKPTKTGIKQTYILRSKEAASSLSWIMTASDTLENTGMAIRVKRSNILIDSPVAWDAEKKSVPVTVTVSGDTLKYEVSTSDAVYPIYVDPTTELYQETDALTGTTHGSSTTYADARNGAYETFPAALYLGQAKTGGATYQVYRNTFWFDTSNIPDDASISSAYLHLQCTSDVYNAADSLHLLTGTFTGSMDTTWHHGFDGFAISSDYDGITKIAQSVYPSSFATDDSVNFTLNATGLASISKTGDTKFFMLTEQDRNSNAPSDDAGTGAGYGYWDDDNLYLSITYEVPPVAPSGLAQIDSTETTVTLGWTDNSDNEDGFFIKSVGLLGDTTTVESAVADAESVTVTGLANWINRYIVVAHNSVGEAASDTVSTATVFQYNNAYSDSLNINDFYTHKATVSETYADVRGAVASLNTAAVDTIGQTVDDSLYYHVWRLSLEVYDIAWTNNVTSAQLQINLLADASVTDFELQVYEGEWEETGSEDTRFFDFDGRQGTTTPYNGTRLNDVWSTASFAAGILTLDFNQAGLDLIETVSQAGDSLRLVIISSLDSSSTAPTGNEFITLDATSAKLVYTWQRLTQVPSTFSIDPDGTTTITATWDDRALDETGYSVVHAYWGDYDYMQTLTVDSDKIDSTLTNFPVMVRLIDGVNFDKTHAESDGSDIWFLNGTAWDDTLDFGYSTTEPFWVSADGDTLITWVKVPSISSSTDTDFYMIYGNSDAPDLSNSIAVWDDNFVMVQHMSDSTTAITSDATSNGNIGTKVGANEPIEVTGQIGMAQDFDGTDDYIDTGNAATLQIENAIAVSCWLKAESLSNYDAIIVKTNNAYDIGWALYWYDGNLVFHINSAVNKAYIPFTDTSSWHHIVGVFNGSTVSIYLDSEKGTDDSFVGTITDNTNSIRIGFRDGVVPFEGLIDEVRLSNIARSAAWIKADYYTAVDSLLSYGPEVDLVYGTAAADAETVQLTSLSVNTLYRLGIRVDGGVIDRQLSAVLDSCYTFAAKPNIPLATYTRAIDQDTHVVYNDTTGLSNPSYTLYALQDSISGLYVQLVSADDDTLGSSADWNTFSDWLDSIVVHVDSIGKTRAWRFKAKSGQ